MAEKSQKQIDRCVPRIKRHYSLLSVSERRVADVVLRDSKHVLNLSVGEWANEADTSKASVVRFCKGIGFSGVTDFKQYLRHDAMSFLHDEIWAGEAENPLSEIAKQVCQANISTIHESLSVLDMSKVSQAADAILAARTIHIFGEGASGTIGRTLQNALLQMGLIVTFCADTANQLLCAACLGREDLVMVVNHSGSVKNVVESMSRAKTQGAKIIAIVGIVGSPVDMLSDISLHCGLAAEHFTSDLISSRISELNVVSILLAVLTTKGKERIKDYRSKNQEIMKMKRIPEVY